MNDKHTFFVKLNILIAEVLTNPNLHNFLSPPNRGITNIRFSLAISHTGQFKRQCREFTYSDLELKPTNLSKIIYRNTSGQHTRSMFARLRQICYTGKRTHQDVDGMKITVIETLTSLVHVNATERSLKSNTAIL